MQISDILSAGIIIPRSEQFSESENVAIIILAGEYSVPSRISTNRTQVKYLVDYNLLFKALEVEFISRKKC